MNDKLNDITLDELGNVNGGARSRQSTSPFGFLEGPYKGIVFNIAAHKGGPMLAEQMYGPHTTRNDKARGEAALKQFLVEGNKLPDGVPNLFGR